MDYSDLPYQGPSKHCYDFNQGGGQSRQYAFPGVTPIPVAYTEMAIYGKKLSRKSYRLQEKFLFVCRTISFLCDKDLT